MLNGHLGQFSRTTHDLHEEFHASASTGYHVGGADENPWVPHRFEQALADRTENAPSTRNVINHERKTLNDQNSMEFADIARLTTLLSPGQPFTPLSSISRSTTQSGLLRRCCCCVDASATSFTLQACNGAYQLRLVNFYSAIYQNSLTEPADDRR